jgi:ABC-2 type transport system ATP-binding protein
LLRVSNLVKYYRRTLAVDGVSFDVRDGEIVGLLGPNGAGKTTVLRCITGIVQSTEGEIEVDGLRLSDSEEEVKRRLAFVPEVPTPFEMLTVWEHLRFIAMAYDTMDNFDQRADELMRRFDLTDKRDDLVLSLSKGMKQKLAVACAFIHDARVILLDEPLIGIDPKGVHELKQLLTQARDESKSILISTHMLDTAERLCSRIVILQHGSIVAEGSLQELHERAEMGENASLEDVFLNLTEEGQAVETADLP